MPFQNMSGTGLRPKGSGSGSFLEGILAGAETFIPAYKKAKETQKQNEQEKVNTYINLRKAGYSKEDAADIATGVKKFGSSLPTGEDEFERDKKKEGLDIESKQLDVEKKKYEKSRGWTSNLTATEKWRADINKAKNKEISWDDLQEIYPDRVDTIKKLKKQHTPAEKSADFKEGTGGLISRVGSYFKGNQAELTDDTKKVISAIKSEADLEEFIDDIDDYQEAGVDVNAVLEYFGRR